MATCPMQRLAIHSVVIALMLWSVGAQAAPKKRASPLRRLYVRGVFAAYVEPRITAHDLRLAPSPIARTAVGAGAIEDAGVRVNASTSPTAIIGYVVPRMRWGFSIEMIIAPPSKLEIEATGRLANESIAPEAVGVATGIPPLGRYLAEATMTAPIVSAIVRPLHFNRFVVFAGVGVSVLFVYDERVTNAVLNEVGSPKLAVTNPIGAVVQAGIEGRIWGRWKLRIDGKYVAYRESHARIDGIEVKTQIPSLPTVDVGSARIDVAVRPIIIQCGIGADF